MLNKTKVRELMDQARIDIQDATISLNNLLVYGKITHDKIEEADDLVETINCRWNQITAYQRVLNELIPQGSGDARNPIPRRKHGPQPTRPRRS